MTLTRAETSARPLSDVRRARDGRRLGHEDDQTALGVSTALGNGPDAEFRGREPVHQRAACVPAAR